MSEQQPRPERNPYRLFFDGRHIPCKDGRGASPARISVWEIHPVYAVNVCQNRQLAQGDATDDAVWVPLYEWFALEEVAEE